MSLITVRFTVTLEDISPYMERDEIFRSLPISVVGSFNDWSIDNDFMFYSERHKLYEYTIEMAGNEHIIYKFFLHTNGGKWLEPKEVHTIAPIRQVFKNEFNSFNYVITTPTRKSGASKPFGVTLLGSDNVNISVYASNAIEVYLCLYGIAVEKRELPLVEIPMFNVCSGCEICKGGGLKCIDDMWTVLIPRNSIPPSTSYIFKVKRGNGSTAYASDPFCKYISGGTIEDFGVKKKDVRADMFISRMLLNGEKEFDWGGERPLNIPLSKTVIYEVHVRGFTKGSPSVGDLAGTYLGLATKARYLQELGITAVELLPIHEFDETSCGAFCPNCAKRLTNYWGYSTVSFFCPCARYATKGGDARKEFKMMVKELHRCGIEVILDVVYNHVDILKAPFDFLSKDYFILDSEKRHTNYSGCGNTVATNHPMGLELIIESLRYWVTEFHVDGFRFDLAAIFCRHQNLGTLINNPPIVDRITSDPILSYVKLIAEPWDIGSYKVGSFPHGERWLEWNDNFRDSVRKGIRGDSGVQFATATAIAGSPNLYNTLERGSPLYSVNFVTAHDGFTLRDVFSYNRKHNLANGEGNRDGSDNNYSFNYGVEGPITDSHVIEGETPYDVTIAGIRLRQIKNSFLMLALSRGVPMIQAGDEYGRTTLGNNNMWNQDTSYNYFDWSKIEVDPEARSILSFVRNLFKLRSMVKLFHVDSFGMSTRLSRSLDDIDSDDLRNKMEWYTKDGTCIYKPFVTGSNQYNQSHEQYVGVFNRSNFLSYVVQDYEKCLLVYVAFNAAHIDLEVTLPEKAFTSTTNTWFRLIDTSLDSPKDFLPFSERVVVKGGKYCMSAYSSVLMVSDGREPPIVNENKPPTSPVRVSRTRSSKLTRDGSGSIPKSISDSSFFVINKKW